jgi:hypothetical protein
MSSRGDVLLSLFVAVMRRARWPPARKTIPVEALRDLLGNDKTDELLSQLKPPPPTIRVLPYQLRTVRNLYSDPVAESSAWESTIAVVRRYFLERGAARRAFLNWVGAHQDDPELVEANGNSAPKRRRRQITGPAVLERRRAALAKARAVRAEKRRTAKG